MSVLKGIPKPIAARLAVLVRARNIFYESITRRNVAKELSLVLPEPLCGSAQVRESLKVVAA